MLKKKNHPSMISKNCNCDLNFGFSLSYKSYDRKKKISGLNGLVFEFPML